MYKYFNRREKVFLNTSQASPAPDRYHISNSSPAPEKYLNTLLQRSIYTHFSGAGEVLIYIYLAPEKPEKYLYTLETGLMKEVLID